MKTNNYGKRINGPRRTRWGLSAGFTLIEIMMSISILTIVMGILFGLSTSLSDTSRINEVKTSSNQEARGAISRTMQELRQCSSGGITGMPGPTITYQVATDVDGNGTAVDVACSLELGPAKTIKRDTNDENGDRVTEQLILVQGTKKTVLANRLLPNEDANNNGVLDSGEDKNRNGRLDRGIWFERIGGQVRVTIQTYGTTRQRQQIVTTLTESVLPRN